MKLMKFLSAYVLTIRMKVYIIVTILDQDVGNYMYALSFLPLVLVKKITESPAGAYLRVPTTLLVGC